MGKLSELPGKLSLFFPEREDIGRAWIISLYQFKGKSTVAALDRMYLSGFFMF